MTFEIYFLTQIYLPDAIMNLSGVPIDVFVAPSDLLKASISLPRVQTDLKAKCDLPVAPSDNHTVKFNLPIS